MLAIQTLINVTTSLTQSVGQSQSTTSLLVLTNNTVIDLVTRIRSYSSLAGVATDFGTSGYEYQSAQLFFGQSPQPTGPFYIGRWAQTAAAGQLIGAPLTATQQAIANFQFANAGFTATIDGGSVVHYGTINTSAISTLSGIAAAITTAFAGIATCIWNPTYARYQVTSATTGATSAVSFFSAPTGGPTDISNALGLNVADTGSYQSNGQAAETALACVTLFDTQYGGKWYALQMPSAVSADHVAVAPYIEATQRKHFYGVTTSDPNVLVPSSTTDVAYLLSQLNLMKTAVQFCSTNGTAIASMFGLILGVNYSGSKTAINLMYQNMPSLVAENLVGQQFTALQAKNCNVFATLDNGTNIFLTGTTVSTNVFVDTVIGADNYAIQLTTNLLQTFVSAGTKIGQDDAGMHTLVSSCESTSLAFVNNGYLGAGTWNSAGFGAIKTGSYLEKGFYIYAPPVATQAQVARTARMAVPIQIAAKLEGAINTATVAVTINP